MSGQLSSMAGGNANAPYGCKSFESRAGALRSSDDAYRGPVNACRSGAIGTSVRALSLPRVSEARTFGAKHERSGAMRQGVMLVV